MTKNTRYAFARVEKLLRETFLPCLFFGKSKSPLLIVGTLSIILVKKDGLGLQNSVKSANEKLPSLQRVRMELIRDVTGEGKLLTADHLQTVKEERSEGKNSGMTSTILNLKELLMTSLTLVISYFSAPYKRVTF